VPFVSVSDLKSLVYVEGDIGLESQILDCPRWHFHS